MSNFEVTRAIDGWVNANLGVPPDSMDVTYLFPDLAERWRRGTTLSQLVEEMEAAGIEKAVLCSGYGGIDDHGWVCDAIANYPERFVGSYVVDPREGLSAVRLVERLVREEGFRLIRVIALFTQIPYNDARCYPVYAKCAELEVPVGLNVGIPGPLVPGKHQHPLAVDDVCSFFPELTVIFQHGGEPWVDLCIKLMVKWSNLYYMTSAFAPKHIPSEIIDYINTRGADKVMFASDYPLLTFERCVKELRELPIRDEGRFDKFVRGNAERLFFSGSASTTRS